MADVRYQEATRIYDGADTPAVDNLDVDIEDGEFLVLVGPSGSAACSSARRRGSSTTGRRTPSSPAGVVQGRRGRR
jgi:ABC-type taurine transport system ATPase subunit